jgi:hypothetical protein
MHDHGHDTHHDDTHHHATHRHDPHHAGDGPVVLDIGGRIGAVVMAAPGWLLGREVEAVPADAASDGPPVHVGVVARPVPGASELQPTAVFGELEEGAYALRLRDAPDGIRLPVLVVGGRVTMAAWPTTNDAVLGEA